MTNLTIFLQFLANKGIDAHVITVPCCDVHTVIVECPGSSFQFEGGKLVVAS